MPGDTMVKCKVIEEFTLNEFDKIKNVVRASAQEQYGRLYVNDIFECTIEMAEYLSGNNDKNKTVVKIIEYNPQFDN